jgi:RNA polymerase sigma-70 factor, ECF subfamily
VARRPRGRRTSARGHDRAPARATAARWRFEVARRRRALGSSRPGDLDDLATQAADDALLAILRKLHTYRGDSRFTTWAYKFALLEAAVKVRRRAWHDREVPLESDGWARLADHRPSPARDAEAVELIGAVGLAIAEALTPHQRTVLIAVTLNDVPIDVLAERLSTARSPLQDPARRAQEAEGPARGRRPRLGPHTGRSDPVNDLLRGLLGPGRPELTCDECFDQLDRYVELELGDRDADAAVPGMRAHLEGCPACDEDHESLLALLGAERERA